ncbi:MAG: glycosyltransferase family 2 protein [Gammaproteobacteria bacterium]|nr:glycosyltransferase family 2 protein [Gammaproteobacteria bacterium]
MELSIVIPIFNEAENIRILADEIRSALDDRYSYEVIFVDDCSSDGSQCVLRNLRTEFPQFRALRHQRNSGQSTAVCNGVLAANAEWIATLDGDCQNDPADIPAMMDMLKTSAGDGALQMVVGYRKKRQDSWLKRISSKIANGVRSRLLGDATPDTGCGLKLFSRAAFLELPYFDHMHRFLPALIQRNSGTTVSVEVNHRPRARGVSKYGLHNRIWVGIIDVIGVRWLQRRVRITAVEECE